MTTQNSIFDKRIIIFIVSLALFMDALDTTIINTAIPAMAATLNVHPVDLKIALISYLLSLAIFIPISGWVADRFGTKRVFIYALIVFTVSSLWCGNATSLTKLVIGRSVQGLGGAMMMPVGRLILLRTFHRHELVDAMNHVIMVVSFGLMLGPLAGGVITYNLSWQWIFWINIPIGIIAVIIAFQYLKEGDERRIRPFDFVGFVLFGGGLASFIFAITYISETDANRELAILLLVISALLLSEYFLHSRQQKHPIVNTALFKLRTFQISMLGNLFARFGFGGVPFILPLLLQIGLNYTPQESGILLAPIAFGIIFVKAVSLKILRKIGFRRLLLINTVLVGLCLWLFRLIDAHTPFYYIGALTFLFGILISLQFSGMNSLAYSDVQVEDLSSATSVIGTMQQLSQTMGVAISALLLHYFSRNYNNQLTIHVFHRTFFALGMLTFFATFIFLRLRPHDGHQMLTVPAQNKTVTH